MKYLNLYSSFIQIDDFGTLIYNALNGKSVILRGEYISKSSITELFSKNHVIWKQTLKSQLESIDIITEKSERQQIENLKELINKSDNQTSYFKLHVNPTLNCNFRCWYCYESHDNQSKMPDNIVRSTKKLINKIVGDSAIQNFSLGFFGGEPLLEFLSVVNPLITCASAACLKYGKTLSIDFTSNGYLLTQEIVKFLKSFDVSFQITLDGDKERHDKTRFLKGGTGTFDKIISNIELLLKNGIKIILRINYTAEIIDCLEELSATIVDRFKNYSLLLVVDFQRVWQDRDSHVDYDSITYTVREIRRILRKQGFICPDNSVRQHISQPCYGDMKNYLLVNYDGLIFGCTARDFNETNSIGEITNEGSIKYNERYIARKDIKFSRENCKKCRIAPLCGGGCTQKAIDYKGKGCIYEYTEDDKDRVILDIIENQYSQ